MTGDEPDKKESTTDVTSDRGHHKQREIERLKHELWLRTELARVVTSYTSPEELLPNVLNVLCEGFGANGGAVYFMEKETEEISLKAIYGLDPAYAMKYQKIHLGSHVTGKVAATGEGIIIKDASLDERSTKGVVQMLRYKSAVVTPVTSEGNVVGIIALVSEEANFFTGKDLKLLEFIGAHISLAVVNSFLNREISLEKERTLDILERVDEGIFQAEVQEPLEPVDDLDSMAIGFYQEAEFSLLNPSFIRQVGKDIDLGDKIHLGFEEVQLFRLLKEVLSSGQVKGVERRWMGEDERLMEISMVRVDRDKKVKGVKGTRRDVTKRIRMQDEIRESKKEMELYIDLLAHDISNVNTVLLGFLEIIGERVKDRKDVYKYVDASKDALGKSSILVRKIRSLSKLQNEQPVLYKDDLVERINSVFDMVKKQYSRKTVKMELSIPDSEVKVNCDEMIDEMFENLFRYSIERIQSKEIVIDIEVREWSFGGKRGYLISFSDRGKTIPDDMKEGLFDKISPKDVKMPGTTLGLSLVKRIGERYGGKVWVEDRIDENKKSGARFRIFVPRGRTEEEKNGKSSVNITL